MDTRTAALSLRAVADYLDAHGPPDALIFFAEAHRTSAATVSLESPPTAAMIAGAERVYCSGNYRSATFAGHSVAWTFTSLPVGHYAYKVITAEEAIREIDALASAADESRALAQLDADAHSSAETEPATPSPAAEPEAQPVPAGLRDRRATPDHLSGDVETCRTNARMDSLRGCPRPMGA